MHILPVVQENKIEKLPVVDANFKLIGLITFRDITKLTQKPNANKDKFGRLRVAAAIGVSAVAVQRAEALVNAGDEYIKLQVAKHEALRTVRISEIARDIAIKFNTIFLR